MSSDLGTLSIDGLASGIDTEAMLQQLAEAQREPISILESRKTEQTDRLETYQSLNTMLVGLGTTAGALQQPEDILSYAAFSSDESALGVSTKNVAGPGEYEIIVEQLATAHKVSSGVIVDDTAALGYSGDIVLNGETLTVEAADTLCDVAAKMNLAGADVYATVIDYASDDHRLVITGQNTGADSVIDLIDANSGDILENLGLADATTSLKHAVTDGAQSDGFNASATAVGELLELQTAPSGTVQINGTDVSIDLSVDSLNDIADRIDSTVADVSATVQSTSEDGENTYFIEITGSGGTPTFTDSNNVLNTLGVLQKGIASEVQAANDAQLSVDGVSVSRSTNSISDLIEGVTLDILEADPAKTVTVNVTQDTQTTLNNVSSILNTYNQIVSNLNQGQSWDPDTAEGGTYFGDPAVRMLEDGLRQAVMSPVDAIEGDVYLPSHIGLSTAQNGSLRLDQAAFTEALAENPLGVGRMFGAFGEADHAAISYISSSTETQASADGGYAVEITQVADTARANSATLASGITTDETLTFNGACTVDLTAGMSLQAAADELNSRFETYGYSLQASVDGDTLVIEHDLYGDRYGFEVKSSLDQGAGGLDIGGTSAGAEVEYTGIDVEGTINGEEATGNGQYLTGNRGNANTEGLVLRVETATTGSKGVVRVSKGIAARLHSYMESVTDTDDGSMTRAAASIEEDIEALDEEIADMQEDVQRYIDRMRSELLAMERAIAEAQNLQQYITNQLQGMTASYSSNSNS